MYAHDTPQSLESSHIQEDTKTIWYPDEYLSQAGVLEASFPQHLFFLIKWVYEGPPESVGSQIQVWHILWRRNGIVHTVGGWNPAPPDKYETL